MPASSVSSRLSSTSRQRPTPAPVGGWVRTRAAGPSRVRRVGRTWLTLLPAGSASGQRRDAGTRPAAAADRVVTDAHTTGAADDARPCTRRPTFFERRSQRRPRSRPSSLSEEFRKREHLRLVRGAVRSAQVLPPVLQQSLSTSSSPTSNTGRGGRDRAGPGNGRPARPGRARGQRQRRHGPRPASSPHRRPAHVRQGVGQQRRGALERARPPDAPRQLDQEPAQRTARHGPVTPRRETRPRAHHHHRGRRSTMRPAERALIPPGSTCLHRPLIPPGSGRHRESRPP